MSDNSHMTTSTAVAVEHRRFERDLERRIELFVSLESARRLVCCYSADPCDCKYGCTSDSVRSGSSEMTGCCEIRDLIKTLTGWSAYHIFGQTAVEQAEAHAERERVAWRTYIDTIWERINL